MAGARTGSQARLHWPGRSRDMTEKRGGTARKSKPRADRIREGTPALHGAVVLGTPRARRGCGGLWRPCCVAGPGNSGHSILLPSARRVGWDGMTTEALYHVAKRDI